jgi:hypothetical protein
MVYASLKEAWGEDTFCREPPENPYVVKDPVGNPANFKKFRKDNFASKNTNRIVEDKESDDESYDETNKYYKNMDNEIKYFKKSDRVKKWCKPQYKDKYFLEEDEYSDITSVDTMDNMADKMIGRKIQIKKPKGIIKNVHEGFQNYKKGDCGNMLYHLQHCPTCSAEVEQFSKNIFIKEFIIFAGCGIIMFLFLDLLRKIAQKK